MGRNAFRLQILIAWVRNQKDQLFFLFYATTLPHGKYEIDDLGIYADRVGWSEHPKLVKQAIAMMKLARVDDSNFPWQ